MYGRENAFPVSPVSITVEVSEKLPRILEPRKIQLQQFQLDNRISVYSEMYTSNIRS